MSVAALLVGAGRGERFRRSLRAGEEEAGEIPGRGALPKAFARLRGEPLLVHAARALAAAPGVECVVPVVPAELVGELARLAPALAGLEKVAPAVAGGARRQDSVRAGLEALPARFTWVAVHDAARPCIRPADVERVVTAARGGGAAILAVPIADTVKRVRGGRVVATPPRAECWAAQTPQVFRRDWLRAALEKAEADGVEGTDDASLVERLGVTIEVVAGDPANAKITSAQDLRLAELRFGGAP
jgi:2-C-methyl-D-erythritol 4-phosphate cytidylyltransferase